MTTAAQVLGLTTIENHKGEALDASLALKGKIVGLYFSASWCPPCVAFSPELDEFAGQNKDDFAVLLISRDNNEQDFERYSSHKENFYRLPWKEVEKANQIFNMFGVYALPTLQIIHSDGTDITSWGRAAVTRNKSGCLASWKNKSSGASVLQMIGLMS